MVVPAKKECWRPIRSEMADVVGPRGALPSSTFVMYSGVTVGRAGWATFVTVAVSNTLSGVRVS